MSLNVAASDEPVDFLHQRSEVNKARLRSAKIADILVIDDNILDARAVSALLRSAFGRDAEVRHSTTLLRAKTMLLERKPDLIVLDDILPPKDRAENSIAALRQSGYAGTIVVISCEMTWQRRLTLLRLGATSVVHKDDLNATSLAEAVVPAAAEAGGIAGAAPAERQSSNGHAADDDGV